MRARLAPFRRLRLDPLQLDWMVAALLTLSLELEVWLGSGAVHERLVTALLGPLVTAAVAVRRLYPTIAGVSAGVLVAFVAASGGRRR